MLEDSHLPGTSLHNKVFLLRNPLQQFTRLYIKDGKRIVYFVMHFN